jgi:hypothetical protein
MGLDGAEAASARGTPHHREAASLLLSVGFRLGRGAGEMVHD